MSFIEFARHFAEPRSETYHRSSAVVVLEFGGGSCNKAGASSCADFCKVPEGQIYNPIIDPPVNVFVKTFPQVARLKPAIVSLVPNGESVDTIQKSNTTWDSIFKLRDSGHITSEQFRSFDDYFVKKYKFPIIRRYQKMTLAEKTAIPVAIGKNSKLNISLTTNGSFLNNDLLGLYGRMGLQAVNLSYHPNIPFNPNKYDPALEHLIARAKEAIDFDIIPTITHVLTSENADTFVTLADYITEHDIFFAAGLATARGDDHFSNSQNKWIEPDENQVKMVFRRLLARKLFADRHIRTSIPYLLVAPYVKNSWVCDQSIDFFHLSYQLINGKWGLKLNVCSEIRPDENKQLQDFLVEGKLDTNQYLLWRDQAMKDKKIGCKTCIHQCWFEAEARSGIDMDLSNPLALIEVWDYWDSAGKGLRQRYTFKHPIRPIVSVKSDFQKVYFWESLFQGITRVIAKMETNDYWQRTFIRAGVKYPEILKSCLTDLSSPQLIEKFINAEREDEEMKIWIKSQEVSFSISSNWHDAHLPQSKLLRSIYLRSQKSGKEANLALPLKFAGILQHDTPNVFSHEIQSVIKRSKSTTIYKDRGIIFPLISRLVFWLFGLYPRNNPIAE